jgi:hypothetical protein
MDLSSLRPTEIAVALAGVITAFAASFFGIPKIMSDLGLNRVVQRKHLSELIDALTSSKDGQEKAHPLAVQVKFQAAFGGARAHIPKGSEILAFLENRELAMYSNVVEYAECAKFLAYSETRETFIPRGNRTDAELETKRHWSFIFYLLTATPAFVLFFIPPFNFKAISIRFLLSYLLGLFALVNAVQAKKIGRAQKLLEQTRALEPSSPLTTGKSEAAQEALNGTTHPARPSGIVPEKASGTLPERGASVKEPDPSKH